MAITLRRTPLHNPRTFYKLVDYEVIPLSWIKDVWSNHASLEDESQLMSAKAILVYDAAQRLKDGGLGSVLVISLELPPGSDLAPCDALKSVRE